MSRSVLPVAVFMAVGLVIAAAKPSSARAADQPQAGEVIRTEGGTLSPAFKTQHFCSQDGACHDFVIDKRTFWPVRIDGKWAPGIKETGKGDEVIWEEVISPTKVPAPASSESKSQ